MTLYRSLAIIFCLVLAGTVFLPAARADDWNQSTEMKFSEPIQIPGEVLPAGTYWFVLAPNQGNRNVVQIFTGDRSQLIATVFTVPTERLKATNRTEIKFAERPRNQAEALWKWYFPGRMMGHQFMYPIKQEKQLQRDAKQDLVPPVMSETLNTAMPGA
ncbi:MAG: hypothetical protein ACRD20_07235 [Terriglobales bacterium]